MCWASGGTLGWVFEGPSVVVVCDSRRRQVCLALSRSFASQTVKPTRIPLFTLAALFSLQRMNPFGIYGLDWL